MRSKTLLACLVLLILSPTAKAQTPDFCSQVSSMMAGANDGGFDGKVLNLPGTMSCGQSVDLDYKQSSHCSWSFGYRTPKALEVFERLTQSLSLCQANGTSAIEDLDVNHPDFYDLRTFEFPIGQVSISLKDKGGLNRSLVFLRLVPQ